MKRLLFLAIFSAILVGCSSSEEKPKIIYVEREQPVQQQPENIVQQQEEPTYDEMRREEKQEFAEQVREEVPEGKDLTGRETTYYAIEAKQFDDPDVLKQVRYTLIVAAEDNNYKLVGDETPSQKGFRIKVLSELAPISLTETIRNALADYNVKVEKKQEHLLLITPN